MQWPTDLLRTLHDFAGPWPLATAITKAYDHKSENWAHGETVQFPLCGYDSRMNPRGWSLWLEVEFEFSVVLGKEVSKLTLRTTVERDDWPGTGIYKTELDFFSLQELLDFLPKLDQILPKGCNIIAPLHVVIFSEDEYIYYDHDWPGLDLFNQSTFEQILPRLYSPSLVFHLM